MPGAWHLAAPIHARIDARALRREPTAIMHPSYFRDPASLPATRPLVVTVFDLTHERFPAAARLGPERWKRALCARADRVICISESTRRDVVERLGVPESRARVAPLGSRAWDEVTPCPPPNVPEPFALWVGPRYAYKNFEGALAALARCHAARDVSLLCLGGGPLTAPERALVAAQGLRGRVVQRHGSDAGLRGAYEHSGGLLYPPWWAGVGLPGIEALALGAPRPPPDRAPFPQGGGAGPGH